MTTTGQLVTGHFVRPASGLYHDTVFNHAFILGKISRIDDDDDDYC